MLQASVFFSVCLKQAVLHNKWTIHCTTVFYLSCVWEGATVWASEFTRYTEVSDKGYELSLGYICKLWETVSTRVPKCQRSCRLNIQLIIRRQRVALKRLYLSFKLRNVKFNETTKWIWIQTRKLLFHMVKIKIKLSRPHHEFTYHGYIIGSHIVTLSIRRMYLSTFTLQPLCF